MEFPAGGRACLLEPTGNDTRIYYRLEHVGEPLRPPAPRVAAAQLAYDPYAAMEPVIATREDWLREGVRQAAFNAGRDLTNHAANHGNGISGNWSGTLWAYNPSDGIFYAVAPNPFGI